VVNGVRRVYSGQGKKITGKTKKEKKHFDLHSLEQKKVKTAISQRISKRKKDNLYVRIGGKVREIA